ncbi:MAG: CDP-diacylglycerol--glycerol-3-phosphate 3-phosphatidyltransferase [Oscillospiraceae bacterium]|nr:CDP-diacylglycerol--glycerol-3-phosphate 3-phosphatidyltransferase [Oscillospiraceae bacterium]
MKTLKAFSALNDANKLTILRIALVPLFVLFMLPFAIGEVAGEGAMPHSLVWALVIFVIASITDWLDGYIARSKMQITPLGQFLDPIADKILVMAALVCFAEQGWIPAWTVVVILTRDFVVGAVRLVCSQSEEKLVVPARTSGKVKTAITMFSIIAILLLWIMESYGQITFWVDGVDPATGAIIEGAFYRPDLLLNPIGAVFMVICAALNVYSGVQYVWDARYILKEQLFKES